MYFSFPAIVLIITTISKQGWHNYSEIKSQIIDFYFYLGFFPYILLNFLVISNTFLISNNNIENAVKKKYGESFLIDRGYNSLLKSLLTTPKHYLTAAGLVSGCFATAVVGEIILE